MTLSLSQSKMLKERVRRTGNTIKILGMSGIIWEIRDYAVVYGSRYEWGFNGEYIHVDIKEPMVHGDPKGVEITAWTEKNRTMVFNQSFDYKDEIINLSRFDAVEVEDGFIKEPTIEGLQIIETDATGNEELIFYVYPGYTLENLEGRKLVEGVDFNGFEPLAEIILKEDEETMELENGFYRIYDHLTPHFKKALGVGGGTDE